MREDILLEEFGERLREVLQKKLEEKNSLCEERAVCRVMRKNNGAEHYSIMVISGGGNVIPSIYLEGYLEEFRRGKPLDEIAEEVEKLREEQIAGFRKRKFDFRYEALREKIIYRLVNYSRNKENLRDVPYIRVLDLALTFHVLVKSEEDEVGTFQIGNSHMEHWGVSMEELREQAVKNTPRLFPVLVRTMEQVLGCCGVPFPDGEEKIPSMYVVTNKPGVNGASVILYPEVLAELAEKLDSDLYLLPSSIHEFLVIPFTTEQDTAQLREIVTQVNETEVSEEEYLSDEVYRYDRKGFRILRADMN